MGSDNDETQPKQESPKVRAWLNGKEVPPESIEILPNGVIRLPQGAYNIVIQAVVDE